MKSIKTILHKLADEFDSNATAANQSDISHTWGFAASELRLAAAQLPEDLHVTPISPANIAEGAINLYIEYFNRWSDQYLWRKRRRKADVIDENL